MISEQEMANLNSQFRTQLQALMSVDELVAWVVKELEC
jgi:hypothetical protein